MPQVNTVGAIAEIATALTPLAAQLLLQLCNQAKDSSDPEDFLRRKLKADAAHTATQQGVKATLNKKAKKKPLE